MDLSDMPPQPSLDRVLTVEHVLASWVVIAVSRVGPIAQEKVRDVPRLVGGILHCPPDDPPPPDTSKVGSRGRRLRLAGGAPVSVTVGVEGCCGELFVVEFTIRIRD